MRKRRINESEEQILTEDPVTGLSSKLRLTRSSIKSRDVKKCHSREDLQDKATENTRKSTVPPRDKSKPLLTTKNASSPVAVCKSPISQYWLLKAEPESRFVKGQDVKFSIDDLANKTEPEPWDGIRNYAARNNLRSMKRGDLAFFYHSSCKEPAIVGVMQIVTEHTPDLSALDPGAPYYDPKDNPDNPRWSLVHVEFRQKLRVPITLKEIKAWYAEKDHALSKMQLLRLARMSVCKVEKEEWDFLVAEMRKRGDNPKW